MRRFLILFLVSTAVVFVPGCWLQQDTSDPTPADEEVTRARKVAEPGRKEKEFFVFRAKYYRTKGPCIKDDKGWAMPVIDAFGVVEVLKGHLKATSIQVRALTQGGERYPRGLAEDKVYTLRLTPSERTKQQLRENQKEGYSWVWVDGDEIESEKAEK